ncbi:MAG: SgcJ/EcaC family oxidoreductase [Pseudomonadota bacterium]
MPHEEQQIREIHATWIDAVNAGNLALLLTLMTDDVVFLNPGQEPVGRTGFSTNFSAGQQRVSINCRSDLEEVVVSGDIAYTRSRDALLVTPREHGQASRLTGHRITVYRQQPDGHWLLARDAHTLPALAH